LTRSVCEFGLMPGELLGLARIGTQVQLGDDTFCVVGHSSWAVVVSSMFMHGSWFHILGNMWFMWVFGNNVEDVMGRVRFVLFYLLCGAAAAMAQVMASPHSVVPMVGASGAIGGVMGSYAITYPRARVETLVFFGFFIRTISVPAVFMLGYWFVLQLVAGLPSLAAESAGGVAFWAHVGGFVAGVVLTFVFRNPELLAAQRALTGSRDYEQLAG